MTKFTHLNPSEIMIPENIVTRVSEKRIELVSKSFGTESEIFFFVIIHQKDDAYCLVDRYDVYLAAKRNNCKRINAIVISDSDDLTAQLTLSQKHSVNPASIIRLITPSVEKHGLEETLQMFYLDPSFGKMYNANLKPPVIEAFESLINSAYELGVRSVVPVQLFEEIAKRGSTQNQIDLLQKIQPFMNMQKTKFRWPHREYLNSLFDESTTTKTPKKEKKAETPARFFDCSKCGTSHIVTPNNIGPKKEMDGMIIISDENGAKPVYTIPKKFENHLGLSKDTPPMVLSSKNMRWDELKKRLDGKNFLVFVGADST